MASSPEQDAPEASTPTVAKASLVLAILGVFPLGFLAAIPGIICGHIALKRLPVLGGRAPQGRSTATAALIVGYSAIALQVLAVSIALPMLLKQGEEQQRAVCFETMHRIAGAKDHWALVYDAELGDKVNPRQVQELAPLKGRPACPAGGTYTFNPVGKAPKCSMHGKIPADN